MSRASVLVWSTVFVSAIVALGLHSSSAQEIPNFRSHVLPRVGAGLPFANQVRLKPSLQGPLFLPVDEQAIGIFREAPVYGTGGAGASGVAVADLNGDGKTDLVVLNLCGLGTCTNGVVGVLLNNGDGVFQNAVSYSSGAGAGSSANSVSVADVNGDGKPDIIVASNCSGSATTCGSVSVLLGNGDGTFQPAVTYNTGGLYAYSVAVGDVNGDGKPDLVVANETSSSTSDATVGVLLGNGDGTFQPATTYDSGGLYAYSVAIGDLNGDGKEDLVVANSYCHQTCPAGTIGVLLGNGDGTFQHVVGYNAGGTATSVAIADVNHDNKPDVLVATLGGADLGGSVSVLLGTGDGTLQAATTYHAGAHGTNSVAVGDINGDGNPDLVLVNQCEGEDSTVNTSCENGTAAVLLGNGDGTFQPAVTYASGGYAGASVAIGDVNGDGKPDLVLANATATYLSSSNGVVSVLLGVGDGSFRAAATYDSGGFQTEAIATGDLNDDGNLDLVIANQCGSLDCTGGVGVLLGNGDGTFRTAASYASGGFNAASVAVADVNRDGKLDLIVANHCVSGDNYANGTVGVLIGNGDGTFQPVVSYGSGGYYAKSVAVGDLNGDGKTDIVVTNECVTAGPCPNGLVSVLLGKGDGTFQPAVGYGSGGQFAFSVTIADVNGDGKPDLLVANVYVSNSNASSGTVGVLLGNGDGTFQPAVAYGSGGTAPSSMAVGDVNGDGKPDVVFANQCTSNGCSSGTVSVLLGTGDGTLQPALITITPQMLEGSLGLADFNGDGLLDVASGSGSFLLLGNGDGTFQNPVVLGAGGAGIAIGDFNKDGRPDLAVGAVAILLNVTSVKSATSTALSSSQNPSSYGQAVTFTATVTPQGLGTATGTVTFMDGTIPLGTNGLSTGSASFTTSALSAGTHSITAHYSGDLTFSPSSSTPLAQTVNKAGTTTAVASSANPSYPNQVVTFTATVTAQFGGTVTGSVTFKQGTMTLSNASLSNGHASYSTTYSTTGAHTITAVYSGDSNNQNSTSPIVKQVVRSLPATTTTALTTSGTPAFIHQAVTLTATVTSTYGPISDGELVTFYDGTTTLSSVPLSGGVAAYTTSSLKAGSHTIKATYAGDATFKNSMKSLIQVVNLYPTSTLLSSSVNPSTYGQAVIFTATVTAYGPYALTGKVSFKDGTTVIGTVAVSGGVATLKKSNLIVGTHSITAQYLGDISNAKGTSLALNQLVQ